MCDLNKNAKSFIPSVKSFDSIIDDNLDQLSSILSISDLNKNAKPFVPSRKSFESSIVNPNIVNSNIVNSNIDKSSSFIKEKDNNLSKKSGKNEISELTTQLINEKHILINKNNQLEIDIKRHLADKQKLNDHIFIIEKQMKKCAFENQYLQEKNVELNIINIDLNQKYTELDADFKELDVNFNEVNDNLKEVQINFNSLKNQISDIIKLETTKFEKELNEKQQMILGLQSNIEKVSGFYMNYIQILNNQIYDLQQKQQQKL